ncbi:MAG: flagellar hook-basal body complex protein FliE [Sporolactobacillus sp.]
MSIGSINLNTFSMKDSAPSTAAATQTGFANTLNQALGTVNASQQTANQMVTNLANGDSNEDLHNVMIAMQKANILLKATVQVRDRAISAYNDVMNMQV